MNITGCSRVGLRGESLSCGGAKRGVSRQIEPGWSVNKQHRALWFMFKKKYGKSCINSFFLFVHLNHIVCCEGKEEGRGRGLPVNAIM